LVARWSAVSEREVLWLPAWWLDVGRLAFVLVAMSAAVSEPETALRSCREFAQ
jgi:hypothetical protein